LEHLAIPPRSINSNNVYKFSLRSGIFCFRQPQAGGLHLTKFPAVVYSIHPEVFSILGSRLHTWERAVLWRPLQNSKIRPVCPDIIRNTNTLSASLCELAFYTHKQF
jgi:hypothetical protein